MYRLTASAVAAALLATGCCPAAANASGPGLAWQSCTGDPVLPGMECATVDVPADWDAPRARTLTLDIARLPQLGSGRSLGTVLLVPGGPGNSGRAELVEKGASYAGLRQRFQIVSFVPRGVAASRNPLPCSDGTMEKKVPLVLPADEAAFDKVVADHTAYATRCRQADPVLFDHVDSRTVARDMEAIRVALGEERLNLHGLSYGGVPASAYLSLFPRRVRAMGTDGAVPHVEHLPDLIYEGLEAQFGRFDQWCQQTTSCRHHGQDLDQVWTDLMRKANAEPIPVSRYSGVKWNGDQLVMNSLSALRGFKWVELDAAIEGARGGDATGFDFGKSATATTSVFRPVQCGDFPGFDSYAQYTEQLERDRDTYPHVGGHRIAHQLICSGWPTPNPPTSIVPNRLPPTLNTGATVEWQRADEYAHQLPGSRTLYYDGPGHVLYGLGKKCVIEHFDRYFTQLTLPPAGTHCPEEKAPTAAAG